jgi:hypothetical protein
MKPPRPSQPRVPPRRTLSRSVEAKYCCLVTLQSLFSSKRCHPALNTLNLALAEHSPFPNTMASPVLRAAMTRR